MPLYSTASRLEHRLKQVLRSIVACLVLLLSILDTIHSREIQNDMEIGLTTQEIDQGLAVDSTVVTRS